MAGTFCSAAHAGIVSRMHRELSQIRNNQMNEAPSSEEIAAAIKKSGKFAVDSWQSVQSVMWIGALLLGCLAWGLKLEWRSYEQDRKTEMLRMDVVAMENKIDKGILPIAAVELRSLKEQLVIFADDIKSLKEIISTLQTNQIILRQQEILRQNDDSHRRNR